MVGCGPLREWVPGDEDEGMAQPSGPRRMVECFRCGKRRTFRWARFRRWTVGVNVGEAVLCPRCDKVESPATNEREQS